MELITILNRCYSFSRGFCSTSRPSPLQCPPRKSSKLAVRPRKGSVASPVPRRRLPHQPAAGVRPLAARRFESSSVGVFSSFPAGTPCGRVPTVRRCDAGPRRRKSLGPKWPKYSHQSPYMLFLGPPWARRFVPGRNGRGVSALPGKSPFRRGGASGSLGGLEHRVLRPDRTPSESTKSPYDAQGPQNTSPWVHQIDLGCYSAFSG